MSNVLAINAYSQMFVCLDLLELRPDKLINIQMKLKKYILLTIFVLSGNYSLDRITKLVAASVLYTLLISALALYEPVF